MLVPNSNVTINGKGRRYRRGWEARRRSAADLIVSLDNAVDMAAADLTSYSGSHRGRHVIHRGEAEQRVRRKQSELRDADLKWTDLSASLTETQLEYRRLFSSRLQRSSSVDHHPIVRATLSEDRCALCGTNHVAAKVQTALDNGDCPLCDSVLDRSGADKGAITQLQRLDREIARIRDDLATILSSRARISDEFAAAQASEEAAAEELRQFEEKEAAGLAKIQSGSSFSAIQQEIYKRLTEKEVG